MLKKISDDIGKKISKTLSIKYRKKLFGHVKQFGERCTETTFERVFRKTVQAVGNLGANRITDKTTKVSKTLQQNNLETVKNSEYPK